MENSKELFSLGKLYPSDFLVEGEQPRCEPVELKLIRDGQGLVRLAESAPNEVMWGKYWYRSGVNDTMTKELKNIVDSIESLTKYPSGSVWLDIACNDGTLLSNVHPRFTRLGIDPSEYSTLATAHGYIVQEYFDADVYKRILVANPKKASVVTSIAMFYDIEEPEKFMRDVYEIMADDGLWVMQLSYTPLMIQQLAFDNICHEHKIYYCFEDLSNLLYENGFQVMDCQLNEINAGSMRLYIMKQKANKDVFATATYREVAAVRMESLLDYENASAIDGNEVWRRFYNRLQMLKSQVRTFIRDQRMKGKVVWGYGASTKGNTLLQYFELNYPMISGIADRNPEKHGLRTVGTNIPIYSEEDMREINPDYMLILPYHFIGEFRHRERKYLQGGGKFIIPCPQLQIIEA